MIPRIKLSSYNCAHTAFRWSSWKDCILRDEYIYYGCVEKHSNEQISKLTFFQRIILLDEKKIVVYGWKIKILR